jgi:hypothetical protein
MLLNIFSGKPTSQVAKKILEPDQKGPRCEAREESESGSVLEWYVGGSGSSPTKQMDLFQQALKWIYAE